MNNSDVFFSNQNCNLLYKVIQDNVKLETQIDINKNPKYFKILNTIIKSIGENTKSEERQLKTLNNAVINKTIPYFCQIAKKENKIEYDSNELNEINELNEEADEELSSMYNLPSGNTQNLKMEIQSTQTNDQTNLTQALNNFTSLNDERNNLSQLTLNKQRLNDNKQLRNAITFGNSSTKLNSNNALDYMALQINPIDTKGINKNVSSNIVSVEDDDNNIINSLLKLDTTNNKKNTPELEPFTNNDLDDANSLNISNKPHVIEPFVDNVKKTEPTLRRHAVEGIYSPKDKTVIKEYLICIDSKDASGSEYYPYSFPVNINTKRPPTTDTTYSATITNLSLQNIVEIELMSCIVPKLPFNDTSGNRYLILQIDEINQSIYGTNTNLSNGFAILVPDREFIEGSEINLTGSANSETTIKKYILCKNLYPKKTYFGNPLPKLNKITINFVNQDGEQKNGDFAAWSRYWTDNVNILLKISTKEYA